MKKLLQLLKNLGRQKTQDEINTMREEFFVKAAKLKKLMSTPEWKEYTDLINDYIKQCQIKKLTERVDRAYLNNQENKAMRFIAFLDNDIDFAQRLLAMTPNFIKQVEAEEAKIKEEELQREVEA